MSFPTKEERTKCWDARDKYWECLDKHNISDAVKEGPCVEFRKIYEECCLPQWVKHFDRKRSYLQFKNKIEKEGIPNRTISEMRMCTRKRRVYAELFI